MVSTGKFRIALRQRLRQLPGVLCCASLACVCQPAFAAEPTAAVAEESAPPTAEQIGQWIEDLTHDSYAVRRDAAERLLNGGFAARAALLKLVDGPDPEARASARRLIALLDQSEFERRLTDFAADTDGHRGVSLPGWKEFSALIGADEQARTLFVDMQRHEATLLASVFDDSHQGPAVPTDERVARLVENRVTTRRPNPVEPVGSSATMLFIGTLPDAGITEEIERYVAQLAQRPPIAEAIRAAKDKEHNAIRRLTVAWVTKCPNRSVAVVGERLQLIYVLELAEASPLAVSIATDFHFRNVGAALRASALLAVARFGSADDVTALESLLEDDDEISNQQMPNGLAMPAATVQIRDVALATMLHLTGQDPKTYGFTGVRGNPLAVFDPSSLGMDNSQRAAAAKKWREWRATQKTTAPAIQAAPADPTTPADR
jgi:hypothetical protein